MSRIWKTIAIIMLTSLMLTPVFASDNSLAKAIYNDEIDLAMGLIAEGADLDADYLGYSPIKAAVNAGEVDLAIALIDAGANVTGNNTLAQAIDAGEMELAQKLLDAGADLNAEYYSSTPIETAML